MLYDDEEWIIPCEQDRVSIDKFCREQIELVRSLKRKAGKGYPTYLKPERSILSGYRAEMATSRYLRIDKLDHVSAFNGRGNLNWDKGDLEYGIEVKATENPNGNLFCGEKPLREYIQRSSNTPVVGVQIAFWPIVIFQGWIRAYDIQKYPFKGNNVRHTAGYLVPTDKLRRMSELKELIKQWKSDDRLELIIKD